MQSDIIELQLFKLKGQKEKKEEIKPQTQIRIPHY